MDMENVKSDDETEVMTKVKWPDVTAKGKIALANIKAAMVTQDSEKKFRLALIEALQPVFQEVYLLVKTNIPRFEEFLDEFPSLHDLKAPLWAQMFDQIPYNAVNTKNADLKKQLTDMEITIKAISQNLPTTNEFIKVLQTLFFMQFLNYWILK